MRFLATDEQAQSLAARAVNASIGVGSGLQRYLAHEVVDTNDIKIKIEKPFSSSPGSKVIDIDYFNGRMVKLILLKVSEGVWKFQGSCDSPNLDYQSWAAKYPTAQSLIEAEGLTVDLRTDSDEEIADDFHVKAARWLNG